LKQPGRYRPCDATDDGAPQCSLDRQFRRRLAIILVTETSWREDAALSAPRIRACPAIEAEGLWNPFALAAIRLLLHTGCRRDEIRLARWSDVDWERGLLNPQSAMGGKRSVHAGAKVVLEALRALPDDGNPYIIRGARTDEPYKNLQDVWDVVRKRANINEFDCTIFDILLQASRAQTVRRCRSSVPPSDISPSRPPNATHTSLVIQPRLLLSASVRGSRADWTSSCTFSREWVFLMVVAPQMVVCRIRGPGALVLCTEPGTPCRIRSDASASGTGSCSCWRAASGLASAAPPRRVINSRRFIGIPSQVEAIRISGRPRR
jgi:hypothetical protein